MADEQSWLCFETFDVVSDVAIEERVKMADMMTKCASEEERDLIRRKVRVAAPRFFLFLFLQNAPRHSLRASLISGDEWPSLEVEKRPQSSEYAYLEFLKSHMSHILSLIAETDEDGVYLTLEGLSVLDLAVRGARGHSKPQPLAELAVLPSEVLSSGYSESTHRFSLPVLEQWVCSHLALSPFGPHAVRSGARDRHCLCFRSETIGRIATNAQSAPSGQACVLLHKINKQTLAKVEGGLTGNTVYIDNCRSSRIYLLAPMKSVHVERCSHCMLVVGAVEMTLTISNCDSLVVVAACRRLHLSSCSLCSFHLLTATRPVVLPPSHQLTFAPYNTHYPQLGKHLEQCGLSVTFNLWNQPICTSSGEGEREMWTELDPDSFRPFCIPFSLTGSTVENPCELPQQYRDALDRRKRRTKEWYSVVKGTHLTSEQAQQLQTCVQAQFQDWLEITGHGKEIRELELPKTRTQKSTLE
jgi:TBCC domain-containing protein 1